MNLCDYGCGQEAKYFFKNGKKCCSKNVSQCKVIKKKLGKNSRSYLYSESTIEKMKHGWKKTWQEKQDSLPFIEKGPFEKYRIILEEQDGKCLKCGIKDWNGKDLKLHLDHIDGNNLNETRENLRYICPNCHSQTKTYCGKNINNGKNKVSDEELLEAIDNTPSTRQALLKVGLAAKGGNYNRVYRLKVNR